MTLEKNKKILIIGLGLLGGSYAKALKKQGYYVSAITKSSESVEYALKNNMIDKGTVEIDESYLNEADIIVFAVYPKIFVNWIEQHGGLIKPGTVVTDVTGVKGCIVDKIQSLLPSGVEFISAHPMAGRESGGIENSDDSIFCGANYIVVPTDKNTEQAISLCKNLGETLGFARISVLSPNEHDKMIAFLSQLTHCIAVSLMCANGNPDIVKYTGDSFRDLTRIANINDEMWSELFLLNRDALLSEMDDYRKTFDKLYDYIKDGKREEMREMMRLSSSRRREFNKKN